MGNMTAATLASTAPGLDMQRYNSGACVAPRLRASRSSIGRMTRGSTRMDWWPSTAIPAQSISSDAHAPASSCFSRSVLPTTSTEVSVVMCMTRRTEAASAAFCVKRNRYQQDQYVPNPATSTAPAANSAGMSSQRLSAPAAPPPPSAEPVNPPAPNLPAPARPPSTIAALAVPGAASIVTEVTAVADATLGALLRTKSPNLRSELLAHRRVAQAQQRRNLLRALAFAVIQQQRLATFFR